MFSETYGSCGSTAGNVWSYPGPANTSALFPPMVGDSIDYSSTWNLVPQSGVTQANCSKGQSQSFHPGSVVVGVADGSVKTVSANISQPTWQNALTPSDGAVLGSDW